jgi:outer membrane receptor protein involved in Fe transport
VFKELITQYRGNNSSDGSVFPGNVLHQLRNGAPVQVILFAGPTRSLNGLWTYAGYVNDTWQPASRVTLNLGLRYERYRGFLPAQDRAASTFFPEALSYEAKDDVFHWNLLSPRLGVNYDLFGDGKTLLKFNYGQYWWNPGTALAGNVNENPADAFRQYAWTDPNGDGVWQNGEQGALLATAGGRASASIDPDLEDTFTREYSVWLDREMFPNFGVRTGVVYRRIDQQFQTFNRNRPYDGFTVPITVTDPGPDGSLTATADNGASYTLYNLAPAYVGLATQDYVTNGDGVSEFWTWEISGTKRMSDKWSVLASYSYRWNQDFASAYLGNNLRASTLPVSPNDLINTDEGRYNFNNWTFKASGTYEARWGLRLSPSYRFQAGQPFGRTFLATTNYGQQRVLAEPIDSQAQRNFSLIDMRIEKTVPVGRRKIGLVLDIYNLTNANAEQNINWASGSTYLAPSNIIGPRIVRFGGRFDW